MKPKRIELGSDNSGIYVTFVRRTQMINISGHYDTYVGIQGGMLTLRDFFDELGITEAMCKKSFKEVKE